MGVGVGVGDGVDVGTGVDVGVGEGSTSVMVTPSSLIVSSSLDDQNTITVVKMCLQTIVELAQVLPRCNQPSRLQVVPPARRAF